jgi:predicted Rossmann-fold nucleotide-binding protein
MRGPVSPDGYLAAHPEMDGKLAMVFSCAELGRPLVRSIYEGLPNLQGLGRSVLGQVGVDIEVSRDEITHDGPSLEKASQLFVPFSTEAHTTIGKRLVEDMHTIADEAPNNGKPIKWNGQDLPVGRYVDLSQFRTRRGEEVERDIRDGLVYIEAPGEDSPPQYRFDSDGVLQVKLNPIEFKLHPDDLETTTNRLTLLGQGRSGVKKIAEDWERDPYHRIPKFLLGGLPISVGPYYWRIVHQINDHLIQLKSAALFDENRTKGTGRHLPAYDRIRQVELVRLDNPDSTEPKPTFGNTWIPVELFTLQQRHQQGKKSAGRSWQMMSRDERIHRHQHGVTPLKAIGAENTAKIAPVTAELNKPNVDAIILNRNGLHVIKKTQTEERRVRQIARSLRKRARGVPDSVTRKNEASKLVEEIGLAGDQTAVVFANYLNITDLETLANEGARAFVLRNYNVDGSGIMDAESHNTAIRLVRKGIGLAWITPQGLCEFDVGGQWAKPNMSEKKRQVQLPISIFGANRDEVGRLFSRRINNLLTGLAEHVSPEKIMVNHGNGGGLMWIAHLAAKSAGAISSGCGIDKEGITNTEPDLFIDISTEAILTRQDGIERKSLFAVFADGAIGSVWELWNCLLARKLLFQFCTPIYILNETGNYKKSIEQLEALDEQHEVVVDGQVGNFGARKDAPRKWLRNMVVIAESEDEIIADMMDFMENMADRLEAAGVPYKHALQAFDTKKKIFEEEGQCMPDWVTRGMEELMRREQERQSVTV